MSYSILQTSLNNSLIFQIIQKPETFNPIVIIFLITCTIFLIGWFVKFIKSKKQNSQKIQLPLVESKLESPEVITIPLEPIKDCPSSEEEICGLFVDSKNLFNSFLKVVAAYIRIKPDKYTLVSLSTAMNNKKASEKSKGFDMVKFLNRVTENRNCVIKNIYRGYPIIPHGEKTPNTIKDKYEKIEYIKYMKRHGFNVPEGGVETIIDGRPQEKGVDIMLALDAFEAAKDKLINTVIIVSSDRDFIPLILRLKSLGIKVIYVSTTINISNDIKKVVDEIMEFTNEEMSDYIREKEKKAELV